MDAGIFFGYQWIEKTLCIWCQMDDILWAGEGTGTAAATGGFWEGRYGGHGIWELYLIYSNIYLDIFYDRILPLFSAEDTQAFSKYQLHHII